MNTHEITHTVAAAAGVRLSDLLSPRRHQDLVCARAVCAHLMRENGYTMMEIARALGRSDHTTALNLLRRYRQAEEACDHRMLDLSERITGHPIDTLNLRWT